MVTNWDTPEGRKLRNKLLRGINTRCERHHVGKSSLGREGPLNQVAHYAQAMGWHLSTAVACNNYHETVLREAGQPFGAKPKDVLAEQC